MFIRSFLCYTVGSRGPRHQRKQRSPLQREAILFQHFNSVCFIVKSANSIFLLQCSALILTLTSLVFVCRSRTPLMEQGNEHALRQRTPSKSSPYFPRSFKPKSLFSKQDKEAKQPARLERLNEDWLSLYSEAFVLCLTFILKMSFSCLTHSFKLWAFFGCKFIHSQR